MKSSQPPSHQFDEQKWLGYSFGEQMGNFAVEGMRALNAKSAGRDLDAMAAMFRAVDLVNATIRQLARSGSGRLREVMLAREMLVQSIVIDRDEPALAPYFVQLAYIARRDK